MKDKSKKNIKRKNTINRIFYLLPYKKRKSYYYLFAGLAINGILETITAGTIAFYVSAISDPINIWDTKIIVFLNTYLLNNKLDTYHNIIISLSVVLIFIVVLKNTVKAVIDYTSERYSASIAAIVGEKLLTGYLNVNYEWHLHKNSSDLSMVVLWRKYFGTFVRQKISLLCDTLMVLLLMSALFFVTPIVSIIVVIIIGLTSFLLFRKVKKPLDETSQKNSEYNMSLHNNITNSLNGIKDVKIFGRETFFIKKYLREVAVFIKLNAMQRLLSVLPTLILETVGIIAILSTVMILFFVFQSTVIKITGTMALLAVTAWRVIPAINRILSSLTKIRISLPYINEFFKHLSELNSIEKIEKTNLPKTVEFNSYIQFQNVSFRYKNQDNYALKGINFNLKKGQTLGIIGISGAGKSTLVDIFIGLLNTEQGKILVDGKELDNHKRKLWTQNIGYVPQAPYLIDGTISDNIAFGITKENIDHSLVLHSTQISSMDDFVLDLPQGLSTFIGERGARLSGGQRQRIAMARALYKTPDIIIFDEATSALDTKNESEIKKTINSFKNKKTMIIIAHSLESVDECDWIIWLDKGRIVKQGKAFEVISEYKTFLENMKFNEN